MDPQKLVEMRRSLEQNNKDYAEYVNGLNNWEDKLKSKKKNASEIYKDIPAIRTTKKPVPDARISSDDYNKWDKFDAEKAIEEVDKISSDVTPKMRSDMLKTQGNEFYKKGEYDQAVSFYTEAIPLVDDNSILLSNRAMAFLKIERFAEAERDCDAAIALDSLAIKAYVRRGQARLNIGVDVEGATSDFEKVLSLDEGNKMAAKFLKQIKLSKMEPGTVLPILKRLRQRKPMIELNISEVGIVEESKREFHCPSETNNSFQENYMPSSGDHNDVMKSVSDIKLDNEQVELISPSTSYQFERDWKIAVKDPLSLFNYFKGIEVNKYSTIFGSCLNVQVLETIVKVLKTYYIMDYLNCFDVLKSLYKVKRFKLTIMLLDEKVKNDIEDIFSYIYNNPVLNNTTVAEVLKFHKIFV